MEFFFKGPGLGSHMLRCIHIHKAGIENLLKRAVAVRRVRLSDNQGPLPFPLSNICCSLPFISSINVLHHRLCPWDCSKYWGNSAELYGLCPERVYWLWDKSY